jgi:hypothetical protein
MKPVHVTRSEALKAGFSSRRHRTTEANREARELYQATHGLLARQEAAKDRLAARTERSDLTQLNRLDAMFGINVGAVRERANLCRRIGAANLIAGMKE